ncbi:MAG: GntR family transcriptional regulator [Chloroflexota bacterium]|jgi:DNA-binding GntR family transcriptional regulator
MAKSILLHNYPDLGEKVYEAVRNQIVNCELAPGSSLPAGELARQLGVSLTPVRDALNRLAAEGLVEDVARKGYFVARLDPEDIVDLLEARRLIELAAAEAGIEMLDASQLAEMRRLVEEMEQLVDPQGRYIDYAKFSKRDSQFHLMVVGSAGSRRLVDVYRRLSVHVHIYRRNLASKAQHPVGLTDAREHRAILEGFESKNLPALKAALNRHVKQVTRSLTGSTS